MTLLAIVVVVSWMWMMTTALHLDDARTETPRSSPAYRPRRRPH
jgi:signal transduction histidine kinase